MGFTNVYTTRYVIVVGVNLAVMTHSDVTRLLLVVALIITTTQSQQDVQLSDRFHDDPKLDDVNSFQVALTPPPHALPPDIARKAEEAEAEAAAVRDEETRVKEKMWRKEKTLQANKNKMSDATDDERREQLENEEQEKTGHEKGHHAGHEKVEATSTVKRQTVTQHSYLEILSKRKPDHINFPVNFAVFMLKENLRI